MKHAHDFENDFLDPGGWSRASYTPDLLAELGEPLPDVVNEYRVAALYFCRIMFCIDEFATTAPDARIGVVAIAIVLGWPSTLGLSISNIADQLGCAPAALTRSIARFKALAGLDSDGDIQRVRPGAEIERRQADFDSCVH